MSVSNDVRRRTFINAGGESTLAPPGEICAEQIQLPASCNAVRGISNTPPRSSASFGRLAPCLRHLSIADGLPGTQHLIRDGSFSEIVCSQGSICGVIAKKNRSDRVDYYSLRKLFFSLIKFYLYYCSYQKLLQLYIDV